MRNLLTLIRFPNLLIIVLTQILVQACLLFSGGRLMEVLPGKFWLLTLSTVLIAAAGYIINDYYDIKIDAINKPDRIIIGKDLKIMCLFGNRI